MNIFVSNINFSTTEDSFQQLFSQFGEIVSARIITDRETGRSRGFGFVEMSDEDGQKAIDALNGMEFEGMTINVSVARPREERHPSYNGGNRSYNRGGNSRGAYNQGRYNRGGYNRNGGNSHGGYNCHRSFDSKRYNSEERYSAADRYDRDDRF